MRMLAIAVTAAAGIVLATPSAHATPVKNGDLLYNGWSYNEAPNDGEALFFHAPRAATPHQTWTDLTHFYVQAPRFSADGTQAANTYTESLDSGQRIQVRDVTSGATTRTIPVDFFISYDGLDWAPDGKRLVASSGTALYVVDIASGTATKIVTSATYLDNPAWAPDGSRIAYSDGQVIRLVRPDGTGERLFASTPGFYNDTPTWSPDSRSLAFLSNRFGRGEILSLPRSGEGTPTRISRLNGMPGTQFGYLDLDWSPDGKKIAALERESVDDLDWSRARAYHVDGSGKYWLTPRLDPDGLVGVLDWGRKIS